MSDIVETLRDGCDCGFAKDDCPAKEACQDAFAAADEIERLREAVRLGIGARNAQRAYFKDRTQSNLVASKQAEKAFDDAARAALKEKE